MTELQLIINVLSHLREFGTGVLVTLLILYAYQKWIKKNGVNDNKLRTDPKKGNGPILDSGCYEKLIKSQEVQTRLAEAIDQVVEWQAENLKMVEEMHKVVTRTHEDGSFVIYNPKLLRVHEKQVEHMETEIKLIRELLEKLDSLLGD